MVLNLFNNWYYLTILIFKNELMHYIGKKIINSFKILKIVSYEKDKNNLIFKDKCSKFSDTPL
jgi:hypothetical protein